MKKPSAYNRETYSIKTVKIFIATLRGRTFGIVEEAQLLNLIEGCLAGAEKKQAQ